MNGSRRDWGDTRTRHLRKSSTFLENEKFNSPPSSFQSFKMFKSVSVRAAGKESDSNCGNDEHSGAARRRLSSLKSFQMNLIPEQMAVINAIRAGKSVFFTGSAGTGKSYLLKRLITMLPPQSTFITASAGAAACHIGGTTLHAFAGVFPLQDC